MCLTGLLIVAFVLGANLVREREVAVLVTRDDAGRELSSHVWVIDLDGVAWLRAPGQGTRWLERLRERPAARLSRGDELRSVRGVPEDDPAAREAVNRAMAHKYGLADLLFSWWRDPSRVVPVRLEPTTEASR